MFPTLATITANCGIVPATIPDLPSDNADPGVKTVELVVVALVSTVREFEHRLDSTPTVQASIVIPPLNILS